MLYTFSKQFLFGEPEELGACSGDEGFVYTATLSHPLRTQIARSLLRVSLLFISASAVAIFLCFSFFRIYQVRENSMEPILYNGQKILIIIEKRPKSGDIVVFENPEDKKLVVKRCILSPGDPIIIINGSLITSQNRIPLTTKQLNKLSKLKFILFLALN
jgi:signal peptidase I